MRFMIIVKATKDSEAEVMPEEKLIAEMAAYHEELAKAGVLELTKRFPNPAVYGKEGEIEVRPLFELEDFEPSEAVERFRELGVGTTT